MLASKDAIELKASSRAEATLDPGIYTHSIPQRLVPTTQGAISFRNSPIPCMSFSTSLPGSFWKRLPLLYGKERALLRRSTPPSTAIYFRSFANALTASIEKLGTDPVPIPASWPACLTGGGISDRPLQAVSLLWPGATGLQAANRDWAQFACDQPARSSQPENPSGWRSPNRQRKTWPNSISADDFPAGPNCPYSGKLGSSDG